MQSAAAIWAAGSQRRQTRTLGSLTTVPRRSVTDQDRFLQEDCLFSDRCLTERPSFLAEAVARGRDHPRGGMQFLRASRLISDAKLVGSTLERAQARRSRGPRALASMR